MMPDDRTDTAADGESAHPGATYPGVYVHDRVQRRVYSLRPQPLTEINAWLTRYLTLWDQRLDALHTEIARGKRERRSTR
jgi:hypothetical protein